jgi:hypothetical protein
MQRLVDPAVVIVAMIVPALRSQGCKKSVHLRRPRSEVIRSGYGDSVNPR